MKRLLEVLKVTPSGGIGGLLVRMWSTVERTSGSPLVEQWRRDWTPEEQAVAQRQEGIGHREVERLSERGKL
jgi:hypothetical protein